MNASDAGPVENRVLLLGPTAKDAAMTRRVLGGIGISTASCATVAVLCAELELGAGAVVLTEETLESTQIRLLVQYLRDQPPWSDLPVLLLAGGGANSIAGRRAME